MKKTHAIFSREDLLQKLKEVNKNVLLKFTADNCGPCIGLDQTIENHNPEYDMDIFVINAVDSQDLVDLYEIAGFPTCIAVNNEGKILKKKTGFMELSTYESLCDEYFK